MQQVIIAIHLMVVTALVILVLYQKSEGGALGMGGGSGVFTGRGQANALTRATGILATIFFLTSIALTVLPAWERRAAGGDDWTKGIDQGDVKLAPVKPGEKAPEPKSDSLFDQLQRAQQKRQQGGETPAPAAPTAEAPKVEAPKVEAPKAAEPVIEAPKPATPAPEAPKAETPAAPAAPAPADKPIQWKAPAN